MSIDTSSGSGSPPRFGRGATLGLGLGFLVLGTVFTAPLVWHFREALPYTAVPGAGREFVDSAQGDYLQFYYYLWLVRDRIAEGASFLRDPYQFAVDGPRANLPNTFLPAALLFVPVSFLDPHVAYNLLVLLSFPFCGLATALLLRRYGASRVAAAVAGTLFACAPYRMGALLGGHPAGISYPLVPLALWGVEGALIGSRVGGLVCGLALAGLAFMEPHFFYFAALGLPLYALARIGLPAWAPASLRIGLAGWLVAGAIALAPAYGALAALARQGWQPPAGVRLAVGALIALLPLVLWQGLAAALVAARVIEDPRAAARRSLLACLPWLLMAAAGTGSPRAAMTVAALLPLMVHAAWLVWGWRRWWHPALPIVPLALAALGTLGGVGFLLLLQRLLLRRSVSGAGRSLHEVLLFSPAPEDLLIRANPSAARAVFPGVLALLLAVVAVVALARRPPEGSRRILWLFLPIMATSMVLSLGPRIEAFPLFEVAFRLVPSWNFIRQPAKLQVLATLGLAALAAVGTDALGRGRSAWARGILALVLAAGIATEYHPGRPAGLSRLPQTGEPFDTSRALGPRALWVPFWPGDSAYSGLYLYATTLTRVPMLNGYSAWLDRSYIPEVYRPLESLNLGVVTPEALAALRRYGVRQVLLDRDAFPVKVSAFGPALTLASLRSSPHLDPVNTGPGAWNVHVFRVRDTPRAVPPGAPTSPLGVFWEAESLFRDTGRITPDPGASNGKVVAVRAGADRAGFLVFGPHRLMPPGTYGVRFRARGVGTSLDLQATAQNGRVLLASTPAPLIDGAFVELPLSFTLDAPAAVEFRARWDGQGSAAVDWVAAAFAAEPEPAPLFEVEALAHELHERADPEASGGVAGHATPAGTPHTALWTGPLRHYPPGRYRLWVRVKLDRPEPGVFARCAVQRASRSGEVAGRELRGNEVEGTGRYVELALPFTLTEPAILEFPCDYQGTVGVWFDRLRIERLDGAG